MHARNVGIIESLEPRRLMSGASLGVGGVLRVWGDDLRVNTITVSNSLDGLTVDVSINSVNALGQTKTFTRSFTRANILSLAVLGGSKADTITASNVNSAFTLAMRVDGRGGLDTITTGEAADLIYGAGGDDIISARGGNDRIFGAAGNDNIDAGGDDDRVSGGLGDDIVEAGGGDDFVRGDAGNDRVDGHNGRDLIYGCGGNDTLSGERDDDTLWGGLGNDILNGGDDNDTLGGVQGVNSLTGEDGIDIFVWVSREAQPSNDYVLGVDLEQKVAAGSNEGGSVPAV